jgi:hypothetical protein
VKTKSFVSPHYVAFLTELKSRIASARLHAANLGQPVPDLHSKGRSSASLADVEEKR